MMLLYQTHVVDDGVPASGWCYCCFSVMLIGVDVDDDYDATPTPCCER
jgi:hypothetical protein